MPYLPAAASLSAAHKGRIKNIRAATLRESKNERTPGVVILTFEEESLKYDKQNEDRLGHTGIYTCHTSHVYNTCHTSHVYNKKIQITWRNMPN